MRLILLVGLFLNISSSMAAESSSSSKGGSGITLTPNVPHIYTISYERLRLGTVSYSAGIGYVPPITIKSVSVSAFHIDVRARWHPFSGAFFLGFATGYHSYSGTGSTTVSTSGQNIPVTVNDTVSGMFMSPHFGWLWSIGRFLAGLEIGSQSGIGTKNKLALTINDAAMQSYLSQVQATPSYQTFENSIGAAISTLTNLPYIGLRLGWQL